jgi:hypothetical protein
MAGTRPDRRSVALRRSEQPVQEGGDLVATPTSVPCERKRRTYRRMRTRSPSSLWNRLTSPGSSARSAERPIGATCSSRSTRCVTPTPSPSSRRSSSAATVLPSSRSRSPSRARRLHRHTRPPAGIGLAMPGRPIRSLSRRTGAPQASATAETGTPMLTRLPARPATTPRDELVGADAGSRSAWSEPKVHPPAPPTADLQPHPVISKD